MEGPESFIIEIEKSKVDGLLQEFEGDLSLLASHLKLMNKRMVLINPKFQQPGDEIPGEPAENQDLADAGAPEEEKPDEV